MHRRDAVQAAVQEGAVEGAAETDLAGALSAMRCWQGLLAVRGSHKSAFKRPADLFAPHNRASVAANREARDPFFPQSGLPTHSQPAVGRHFDNTGRGAQNQLELFRSAFREGNRQRCGPWGLCARLW